ncbi:TIGR00282 family metallophosphoesterase [Salsuginibacillus kocurii]|uniref:TIGR00282 family metallophosphoesterase n=1 Tax=Salsuginibacillus kocurii TaxID=427078 RepID=UPI00036DDC18|nr:TIGR00282 family metallophosphoesterase [Salsuginibacillus kocurii]
MKLMFIGDVVGSPGRKMVEEYVPKLKKKYRPSMVVINGENAAHGKGITEKIYKQLLNAGAQAITLGNHAWDKKEIFEFIEEAPNLIRPANFPEGTPGNGYKILDINGVKLGLINLMGRTFMPPLDCPFQKVDQILAEIEDRSDCIFVDFHGEATSEKQAMGWYLDGRVSAVIGTHTHVQTGDERILPNGTAYLSDVGMTGPYDGILGMERETIIQKFKTGLPARFEVDTGREQLSGVYLELDPKTKKAKKIERLLINEDHPFYE